MLHSTHTTPVSTNTCTGTQKESNGEVGGRCGVGGRGGGGGEEKENKRNLHELQIKTYNSVKWQSILISGGCKIKDEICTNYRHQHTYT